MTASSSIPKPVVSEEKEESIFNSLVAFYVLMKQKLELKSSLEENKDFTSYNNCFERFKQLMADFDTKNDKVGISHLRFVAGTSTRIVDSLACSPTSPARVFINILSDINKDSSRAIALYKELKQAVVNEPGLSDTMSRIEGAAAVSHATELQALEVQNNLWFLKK